MNPYIGDRELDPPDEEPEDGLTYAERRQKEFDDFDPQDLDDPWAGDDMMGSSS